jgi:hypothetical protein
MSRLRAETASYLVAVTPKVRGTAHSPALLGGLPLQVAGTGVQCDASLLRSSAWTASMRRTALTSHTPMSVRPRFPQRHVRGP